MSDPTGPETEGAPRPGPSKIFAACTTALGLSVLVGWWLGIDGLTRVLPGLITMKPNAALGFFLAGLALWSIGRGREERRRAVGLSLAVAAIGGLTLVEYISGVDLGIDEVLFAEPSDHAFSLYSGRMHPTTAFDFLILGMASAFLAADRDHRAAHGLVLLAALIAGSTLIGYLYGVRVFVGLAMFHQMALHTTMGMLMLSAGLLMARPKSGLMVSITDPGPGGQIALRLMPVAILTPIVATGLMIRARESGMFDERYGSAVRVTLVIAVFVACIWRSSNSLHRVDQERRRIDSERAEMERRSRFLAESMPQVVWISGPDGEVSYLNRRWFDYTGQEPGGGVDWRAALHPDDLESCLDLWVRSARSGEPFHGEYRLRRRDGAYRWHLSRSEPMRDEAGRVVQWVGTSTDIHDQRLVGERRYRSLIEATTAIVWNTPPSGKFEADQPGWGAFTGQSFEELKGWGWIDAIHPEDRHDTAIVWAAAVEARSVYQFMHRLRRRDGEFRHMIARAVPLIDEEGAVREWIGVHTDVDDQERAHEAMKVAKEAAEAATRAKGEFLANMSHEIRTPMNGVLGMTELALGTDLNPRQREYLGLVKSSADALLTVIDDILDFSKVEAGKLTLEPISFVTRDLVTDTLRCLSLKAEDKGLELACRIAPEVPEFVIGDPGRLRQVLINLVGNALKFTERGEVVVTVEADPGTEPDGDNPAALQFSVADTGIGIPPDKRSLIFAPFEQADGSTTRKYGGTGLGLTISARLIELMGGRIWVEENPGGGSVFRFNARLGRDLAARVERPWVGRIVLDGLRILIVDDNRTNRMILEEILTQWGCRPVAVDGAVECLAAMSRAADRGEPFALVLLDRMMPDVDGCELAGRIRADSRHADARLMMLTSGGADESSRAPALGIGAWLIKPIRQSELLESMLDLIGSEPISAPPSAVGPAFPPAVRRLRVLVADDHPINQKVAARMLEDQGHEVKVVGNGRLAVEALASGAFDAVLMDLQMPEMDGFEAVEAIRSRERAGGGHAPIIALTAHAMAGDRERCLASGFDDYLSKPIRAAALADALARLDLPGSGCPTGPVESPEFAQGFDLEEALSQLDGDESLLREILALFLEDGPRLLHEVRLAAGSGDAAALKILGHTVAGTASHFAASGVIDAARKVEALGKSGEVAGASEASRKLDAAFEEFRRAALESRVAPETTGVARA